MYFEPGHSYKKTDDIHEISQKWKANINQVLDMKELITKARSALN